MAMLSTKPVMTVRQVIEALQKVDPDLPVMAEGCDCINGVVVVSTVPYTPSNLNEGLSVLMGVQD